MFVCLKKEYLNFLDLLTLIFLAIFAVLTSVLTKDDWWNLLLKAIYSLCDLSRYEEAELLVDSSLEYYSFYDDRQKRKELEYFGLSAAILDKNFRKAYNYIRWGIDKVWSLILSTEGVVILLDFWRRQANAFQPSLKPISLLNQKELSDSLRFQNNPLGSLIWPKPFVLSFIINFPSVVDLVLIPLGCFYCRYSIYFITFTNFLYGFHSIE